MWNEGNSQWLSPTDVATLPEGGEALYCEGCDNADEFSSLGEAYDHGWYRKDDADYCSKCAYAEILKEDEKNKSS